MMSSRLLNCFLAQIFSSIKEFGGVKQEDIARLDCVIFCELLIGMGGDLVVLLIFKSGFMNSSLFISYIRLERNKIFFF